MLERTDLCGDLVKTSETKPQNQGILNWDKEILRFLTLEAKPQKKGSAFYSTYSRGHSMFARYFRLPWSDSSSKRNFDLLEYGAGAGEVAVELNQGGVQNNYTGISIEDLRSPSFKALQNANYLVEPFHEYLLRNKGQFNQFDWIGSSHGLEYFPAAIEAFLASYQMLKVGGVFQSCDDRVFLESIFLSNPLNISTVYDYFCWLRTKIPSDKVNIQFSESKKYLEIKKLSPDAPASLPFPFKPIVRHQGGKTISIFGKSFHIYSKRSLAYEHIA